MTYESEMGAIGTRTDQGIASVTQAPPTTKWYDAATALGRQMDVAEQTAQPPPPPTPPPKVRNPTGASPGEMGLAAMLTTFKPEVVRAFNPGDAKVPAGTSLVYSDDGGHNRGYDLIGVTTGSPGYKSWLSIFTALLRDDAPHWVIWGHEEDIHGSDAVKLGKVYDGGALVLNELNKGRKYPVLSAVCTTGMPYDDASANGYKKWNLRNASVISSDNYARKHWQTLIDFGKACGKPVAIPETGIQAQTDPKKYSDAQQKAAMVADHPYWLQMAFVCYFLGGGNDLRAKPKSLDQAAAGLHRRLIAT